MTFQPPPNAPWQPPGAPFPQPPAPRDDSKLGHVPKLASFLLVQGIATLAWALFCVAAVLLFAITLIRGSTSDENTMILVLYAFFGFGAIVTGTLQILAARRLKRFQSRTFVMAVLWGGVASVAFGTMFCCPTALAVLVYGMVVLLDASVIEAFEKGGRA